MGRIFGNLKNSLTNTGVADPNTGQVTFPKPNDLPRALAPQPGTLQPASASMGPNGDVSFTQPDQQFPQRVKPSFLQAASIGADPGGANALSPGLSKGGKLLTMLLGGLQGALAGQAASEQSVLQSGGRRSSGLGTGFMAGLEQPTQNALQQQQLEHGALANQTAQAQLQPIDTPWGKLPWIQAQQRLQMAKDSAGLEKSTLISTRAGVYDTRTHSIAPGSAPPAPRTPTREISTVDENGKKVTRIVPDEIGATYPAAPPQTPAPSDTEQRIQDYLQANNLPNTPQNRDAASVTLATRNTPQPTAEDARGAAQDILAHRLAPSQMSALYGGFGAQAQKFKRMVIAEARKIDPNFDYEQAESEYQFAKSPGFQNTMRYMSSVQESIPMVIDRAKKLANGNVRSINALVNAGKNQVNNVDVKKFQTDRLLVADEIAKILQGGGTGSGTSDAKLSQAEKILSESDSPDAIAGAMADVQQLIGFRKKALGRGTYMDKGEPSNQGQEIHYKIVGGQLVAQ
jgi:hypothetical protein